MVTAHTHGQIKYAIIAPLIFDYIQERFKWTDLQCEATNWHVIGVAKARLDSSLSIQTSKMMYGWQNVGHQKGKMGMDDMCPCCGKKHEDQLHLYQCRDATMETTFYSTLKTVSNTLTKD